MSWFEEQLRYREACDNADLADAVNTLTNAVMGKRLQNALSEKVAAGSAIEAILKYYHCREKREVLPSSFQSVNEQLDYRLRPFGIKYRNVLLDEGWYRHAAGAMLGTLKADGSVVVLLPGKLSGYKLVDIKNGAVMRLNRKTAQLLDKEAICFYEPLPQKALTMGDLLNFMTRQMRFSDILLYLAVMGLSAALGLLSPMFTKWLFSDVLASGSMRMLLALTVFMVCFTVSRFCFSVFQGLIQSRISIKQEVMVQAAVMNRIMSLPPAFFRQYASGDLAKRAAYIHALCGNIFTSIGITGLTSVFSLIYIGQIFAFAPSLVLPALGITLASIGLSVITVVKQIKVTREKMAAASKTGGLTYATITGIQKIKLAGAEKRVISRWTRQYAEEAQMEYNPPAFLKLSETFNLAITLIGTMALYVLAIKNHVSVSDYFAFNTAFAMVSAAFTSFVSVTDVIADIRPTLETARPILETEPEHHEDKLNLTALEGRIEISHLSFRYNETMPNAVEDISLKIEPGEYVAVAGPSGCGKSTLMRLLLGFEKSHKGIILYDGIDLEKIDPESLRKNIGVVMQDGKLFPGDIYSNIVISAPQLTLDEAWEAAEIASIADDIRRMPMGMHTFISEGQGGISGGQKQRLMIARAIAPKPKILMFDESSSALDNMTQRKVTEAIDDLNCTRFVIAHRLSTIQHADRIIYMEGGRICEVGTYEELIEKNGRFAGLVARQRLETEE